MNFFRSIPKSLEEAALIDGASFFTVLRKIYLPLSKADLPRWLFSSCGELERMFTGILYMSDTQETIVGFVSAGHRGSGEPAGSFLDPTSAAAMSERTIKAAQVFIGALPILLVYPFLQKYFVKGIVMGAVKE